MGSCACGLFILCVSVRNVRRYVNRVVSNPKQNPRTSAVKARHSPKVQTFVFGDSALLTGVAMRVDDRKLHEAEIELISDRPYDGRNSGPFKVKLGNDFLLISIA